MKKKSYLSIYLFICKIFVILFFAFFAMSCTFLEKTEDSFLTVTLPETRASKFSTRYVMNTDDVTYFELTLKQSYSVLVENLRANAGSTVEIGKFPVGYYTLEGIAYNNGGTPIAYSNKQIYIQEGPNNIEFTLEGDPAFMLWSNENIYYGDISCKNYVKSNLQNVKVLFDLNNDLWFASGSELCNIKNPFKNINVNMDDFRNINKDYLSKVNLGTNNNLFSNDGFTAEDGRMFFFNYEKSYKEGESKKVNNPITAEVYHIYYIAHTEFTSNTAYAYVSEYSNNDEQIIIKSSKATLESSEIKYETKKEERFNLKDVKLEFPTEVNFKGEKVSIDGSSQGFTIKDTYVIGKKLYVLLSYVNKSFEGWFSNINYGKKINFSIGALLEFDVEGENISYCKTIGLDSIIKEYKYNVPKVEDGGYEVKSLFMAYPKSEKSAFCGPIKILAIKPKKAWILDDGFILDGTYHSGTGINSSSVYPNAIYKRRIIEVDLESGTFKGINALPDDIKLDNQKIGGSLFNGDN